MLTEKESTQSKTIIKPNTMGNTDLTMFNQTVIYDENNDIFVQHLCEFFEINYKYQQKIIEKDHILATCSQKKGDKLLFSDNRKRTCLTREGFLRWIEILNPNIVKESLREQFKTYQKLVVDYLYGKSVVPNIKKQFEIDLRLKELNSQINRLMIEHKQLESDRKQLTRQNYIQLGLEFPEEGVTGQNLEGFHQKMLER